jgi:hypothetical protein
VRFVPAAELERLVLERLKHLGRDPDLIGEVLAEAARLGREEIPDLRREAQTLNLEQQRTRADAKGLIAAFMSGGSGGGGIVKERVRELDERAGQIDRRLVEIQSAIARLEETAVDEAEARAALEAFDPIWGALDLRERERFLHLAIERIDFDGVGGEVVVRFYAIGLKTLAKELAVAATAPEATAAPTTEANQP